MRLEISFFGLGSTETTTTYFCLFSCDPSLASSTCRKVTVNRTKTLNTWCLVISQLSGLVKNGAIESRCQV